MGIHLAALYLLYFIILKPPDSATGGHTVLGLPVCLSANFYRCFLFASTRYVSYLHSIGQALKKMTMVTS